MNEKADVYPFHRLGGRKTKARLRLPPFPGQAIQNFWSGAATWETLFLVTLSFFASRAVLAGGMMPFPAALLAAVLTVIPDKGLWVLLASAGGLVTVSSGHSLGAALAVLALLFAVLSRVRGKFRQKWYGTPVLVAGLTVAVKVGLYSYYVPELYNYLLVIFEAVLAGCAAFLLVRSLPVLRKQSAQGALKKEEIIGGAVLVIAVLTGLSELKIYGIEVKNVAGRVLVLLAAYTGGSGFGAAMGTLVGVIPSITTAMAPGMVAVHSFSGLLAGMFRGFGRVGICIGFILGNVLLSIYLSDYSRLMVTFAETGAGIAIFLLIPTKRLFAFRSAVKNSMAGLNLRPVSEKGVREVTAAKIRDYSRIFRELSRAFGEIACDVRVYEENNLQNLFNSIASKVCKGCSLHRICWDKEFYKTYRNVMDMLSHIEMNGRITEEQISADIKKRCARLKEMAITVNCLFETYKQVQVWQRKLTEGRDILAGQLEGIACLMNNLANEVRVDIRMREDIEAILRAELARAGYTIISLSVTGEGNEDLEVTVSCPSCGGRMECTDGINPLVSRILGQPMTVLNANYCTKNTDDPVCEFKLMPSRAFAVETGFASAAKDSSLISGDSYSAFDLRDGKFAVILSDGMGVGPKAAVESKATITLLEKLLETGFDRNLAVKTVNSILVLGSPDETFATVDLVVLNLMNGTAEFVKIGSAPSFIRRSGQVGMVRANSLPIGILSNIDVDVIQQPMGHDDLLIMVSDGVLGRSGGELDGEAWILDALQNTFTTDPQNIADMLLNKAIANSGGTVSDDMTVIVLRLVATARSN